MKQRFLGWRHGEGMHVNQRAQKFGLGLAFGALLLGGCSEPQAPPAETPLFDASRFDGEIVGVVDGTPIPEDLLQAYLRIRGQLEADPATRAAALKELGDLMLLAGRAREDGLLERQSTQAELAIQRLSWIANQSVAFFAETHPVEEAEVAAEYERQVERTGRQEFKLQHLLAPSEAAAATLIARLDAGDAFEVMAAEQVEQYGVSAAGAIDWVNLAQVPPAFGPAVAELERGAYTSQPVRSEYGWHVVLLEDARPFQPPSLDAVEDGIRATLARRKIEEYLEALREAATIDLRPR